MAEANLLFEVVQMLLRPHTLAYLISPASSNAAPERFTQCLSWRVQGLTVHGHYGRHVGHDISGQVVNSWQSSGVRDHSSELGMKRCHLSQSWCMKKVLLAESISMGSLLGFECNQCIQCTQSITVAIPEPVMRSMHAVVSPF